ncbi:MAG: hypothetical protein U5K43_04045 [Halofilum sp. (in: g-proteobacteria)]|nr:hypothetical protein [Halofilum sp. (in: g-proteobacteria)]
MRCSRPLNRYAVSRRLRFIVMEKANDWQAHFLDIGACVVCRNAYPAAKAATLGIPQLRERRARQYQKMKLIVPAQGRGAVQFVGAGGYRVNRKPNKESISRQSAIGYGGEAVRRDLYFLDPLGTSRACHMWPFGRAVAFTGTQRPLFVDI